MDTSLAEGIRHEPFGLPSCVMSAKRFHLFKELRHGQHLLLSLLLTPTASIASSKVFFKTLAILELPRHCLNWDSRHCRMESNTFKSLKGPLVALATSFKVTESMGSCAPSAPTECHLPSEPRLRFRPLRTSPTYCSFASESSWSHRKVRRRWRAMVRVAPFKAGKYFFDIGCDLGLVLHHECLLGPAYDVLLTWRLRNATC